MRILIVYGTTEGHTATLVELMRETMVNGGHEVKVEQAGTGTRIPPDADGVIVGASVHKTRYQQEVVDFATRNRERLSTLPSAFFQVCLTAADPSDEAKQQTQALVDAFAESTGWHPQAVESFAGKLAWSQYDLFTRVLMKLILRALHRPPEERDASRDHDYTDYDAVRAFAERFAERLVPAT